MLSLRKFTRLTSRLKKSNVLHKSLSKHLISNIIKGDVEVLHKFLETVIEKDLSLIDNQCADFNKSKVEELLRKAGAFEDDRFRQSLLHVAVATNNIEFVKLLLEAGCDVNSCNKREESVLHFAVVNGHRDIVEFLIHKGANLESVLNSADRIRNESLTKFLLDHGADVNCQNNFGESPLHFAAKIDNLTIARMMLRKGACVNKRDSHGWTPLHMATFVGNRSLVELLLDNGADISSETSNAETPLIIATCGHDDNSYDIVKLLLERGAKCHKTKFHGPTAIRRALINCDCRTIKLLLDNGADIRVDSREKFTALHYAAINPHVDVIEYILDYGIDVDARNKDNDTALHIAVGQGFVEGCKLLLSRGADVNCINADGHTPLYLAVMSQISILVKLLLEYGAKVCSKRKSHKAIMNVAKNQDIIVRNILIEHVAKLVFLNIGVSEIELEAIEKDFEMKSYYKKCIEELEKMKIQKVYEDVCLFNILMERGVVFGYARNDDLIEALDSVENQLRYDFPIYYSLLKEDFYREIRKQRLLKGAAIFLNEIFSFNDPFHSVNLKILSYLRKEDIIRISEIG